jgi:DNA-binding NarL/FixJ family response regulator
MDRVRVLLVVDEDDMRLLARSALEDDGRYEIVGEGANGADAVVLAQAHQPDVVLLDLEMPWLHGAEAVPFIRQASPLAFIALWTVAPNSPRTADALALGASVVIDKSWIAFGMLGDHIMRVLLEHEQADVVIDPEVLDAV